MNTTSSTIISSEERTGGSDADEPGSAGESDHPPQSTGTGSPAMEIDVILAEGHGDAAVDEPWLREHLRRAVAHIDHPVARLTVSVMEDALMAKLHRRHCDIDEPTDVLTFAMSAPGAPIEADIAICADIAARRAAERDHDVNRELLLYALHGVLHCAGYDDHDADGSRAMHAEEDRILRAIGVGPVFDARGEGAA